MNSNNSTINWLVQKNAFLIVSTALIFSICTGFFVDFSRSENSINTYKYSVFFPLAFLAISSSIISTQRQFLGKWTYFESLTFSFFWFSMFLLYKGLLIIFLRSRVSDSLYVFYANINARYAVIYLMFSIILFLSSRVYLKNIGINSTINNDNE